MTFLGKLFGKKPPPVAAPAASAPAPSDPSKDPNMIRVHDAYGREMFITKQAWRDSVLLGHIKKVWSQPDDLYATIIQSLEDGFAADVIDAARQLQRIDPDAERGAVTLAIVYLQNNRANDAGKVLAAYIKQHGESGVILTNLAKAYSAQGEKSQSLATLWRGLELDPNQDNGVVWYAAIFRDEGGEPAALDAFRRVAALPKSWRARLWLARDALTRRQLDEALALYAEALSLAPKPVPADLLMQLSGDLGNNGHLPEILQLVSPLFDITQHGIKVGNNLIKANLDLGRLDAARALIDLHYAQKRPDWKATLAFWDVELGKAHVAANPKPEQEKLSIELLSGDHPIWLPEESSANELFPAPVGELVRIAFLGSSAETSAQGEKIIHQMSDGPGRLSRALPLFLAEQVRFHSQAHVRTLVPWLNGESGAFVLTGVPWKEDDAAQHARAGEKPCDYIVLTHVKAVTEPWHIELRLVRTIDALCLASTTASMNSAYPENATLQLARELLQFLQQYADVTLATPPANYQVPTAAEFSQYLLRLEQLLAVRCSAKAGAPSSFLNSEREIVDGCLQLCLRQPNNIVTRVLLAEVLRRMKKTRPQVRRPQRLCRQCFKRQLRSPGAFGLLSLTHRSITLRCTTRKNERPQSTTLCSKWPPRNGAGKGNNSMLGVVGSILEPSTRHGAVEGKTQTNRAA